MAEEIIGKVSDFFARLVVAGIELTAPLKFGDIIRIKGHTSCLDLVVGSTQIQNLNVTETKAGDSISVRISDCVRAGDSFHKITE